MQNSIEITVKDNRVFLLPEKAVWVSDKKILLLSDLHLGKANHFRKSGIPVPSLANQANLENLLMLMMRIKPERIIFLGDLFHSDYNFEWEAFGNLINSRPEISFELVSGNHDVLSDHQYRKFGISLHSEFWLDQNVVLRHEPSDQYSADIFSICGHIHPAVRLVGRGRTSETFPCYWLRPNQLIIPAFGAFTGKSKIKPKKTDRIFFIAEKKVIDASTLSVLS